MRLSMRKIRDALRLKYGLGQSHREISAMRGRPEHGLRLRSVGDGSRALVGHRRTDWMTRRCKRRCIPAAAIAGAPGTGSNGSWRSTRA